MNENATTRLGNLIRLAKELVSDCEALQSELIELETTVNEQSRFARGELAALTLKVNEKRAEHNQILASIASLEQRKAAIAKLLNVA